MRNPRPVWSALADLFLDTEVRWFLPRAAHEAVVAGFSWEETQHALLFQVGPVVEHNLADVAGEWAGWPDEWLWGAIERRPTGFLDGARALRLKLHFGKLIRALRHLFEHFSAGVPEGELERTIAMAHLYIDQDWTAQIGLWSRLRGLECWSDRALRSSWERGIEPAYWSLANGPRARVNWDWYLEFLGWAGRQGMARSEVLRICEELSYLFVVENLVATPRGAMVRQALHGVSFEFCKGPLRLLYPQRFERAMCNWETLYAQ